MTAAVKTDPTLRGAVDTAREAAASIAEHGRGRRAPRHGDGRGAPRHPLLRLHGASPTAAGAGPSRSRACRGRRSSPSARPTSCPARARCSRPSGCPTPSGSRRGTSAPATSRPTSPTTRCSCAGFEATGDEDVDQVALWELGLGRHRVLSAEGRDAAAQRWYDGESGPTAPVAVKAPAPCSTCGFFVPMAGALRSVFGVCANEWSPSDGRVVSLDHGCGAHSEVDVEAADGRARRPADPRRLRARPRLTRPVRRCGGRRPRPARRTTRRRRPAPCR